MLFYNMSLFFSSLKKDLYGPWGQCLSIYLLSIYYLRL
jgi:hypothetical protein